MKTKNTKKTALVLTRDQIEKLNEIVNHFKEINHFTIEVDHSSEIGVGIRVKFNLFEKNDNNVNTTDVKDWGLIC